MIFIFVIFPYSASKPAIIPEKMQELTCDKFYVITMIEYVALFRFETFVHQKSIIYFSLLAHFSRILESFVQKSIDTSRVLYISIQAEAVDKIYPTHANALLKAGLWTPIFPTVGDLWRK